LPSSIGATRSVCRRSVLVPDALERTRLRYRQRLLLCGCLIVVDLFLRQLPRQILILRLRLLKLLLQSKLRLSEGILSLLPRQFERGVVTRRRGETINDWLNVGCRSLEKLADLAEESALLRRITERLAASTAGYHGIGCRIRIDEWSRCGGRCFVPRRIGGETVRIVAKGAGKRQVSCCAPSAILQDADHTERVSERARCASESMCGHLCKSLRMLPT
jgi:hypothetical protein